MAKDITERVRKAQDKPLEHLDYILETTPTLDFVEIVGRLAVMWSLTGCIMTALYMRNEKGGIL